MLNEEDAILYHTDHLMYSLHKGIYKITYLVEKLQNILENRLSKTVMPSDFLLLSDCFIQVKTIETARWDLL